MSRQDKCCTSKKLFFSLKKIPSTKVNKCTKNSFIRIFIKYEKELMQRLFFLNK